MAFGLVDDALQEFREGDVAYAQAALYDANKVLADIEARLLSLGTGDYASFGPLVDELRKSICAAETECT